MDKCQNSLEPLTCRDGREQGGWTLIISTRRRQDAETQGEPRKTRTTQTRSLSASTGGEGRGEVSKISCACPAPPSGVSSPGNETEADGTPITESARLRFRGKNKTTRKSFNQNHFAQLRLLSASKPGKFERETALEVRPSRGALKAFFRGPSQVPVGGTQVNASHFYFRH